MSENVGTIFYDIDVNTAALDKGATRVDRNLLQAEKRMGSVDKQAARTSKQLDRLAESSKDVADTAKSATDPLKDIVAELIEGAQSSTTLTQSLSLLARAIQAVIAANALRSIAEMVQGYQEMEDRVRMATSSTEEFEFVQRRLLATANGTYRSLTEAQELYIRTADSLRAMGYSTAQAIDVTDSMSYAFVTNATSAEKAANATDAFSKVLAKGKVEADAWESIIAAVPSVIQAIAQTTGKSGAEIRKLGAAGQISAGQLTEGLRKSLEGVSASAAKMSNNLRDASTRSQTALTALFVQVENQTGLWQKLTDGIIKASDWLLMASGDTEKLADVLRLSAAAGASLAAVIAGRLVTSLVAYVSGQLASVQASLAAVAAAQAAARANVNLAATEYALATAAVAAQRAIIAAGGSMLGAAADANALAIAEARAQAATVGLQNAQAALTATATRATVAMGLLRNVMGFLGGPLGVVLLAATALYAFSSASDAAKTKVDALNGSLEKLTFNQLSRASNEVADEISGLNKELSAALSESNTMTRRFYETGDEFKARQQNQAAVLDDLNQALTKRRERLDEISKAQEKLGKAAPAGNVDVTLPPDPDAAKKIKDLQDEEALLKVIGVERAKLRALQALGDNASPAQRLEAEKLAISIYNLEQAEAKQKEAKKKGESEAEKATKKAAAEQKKGIEENIQEFEKLGVELSNVGKPARQLAMDQAELSLNNYATPEQVQAIRDMAGALYDAKNAKQQLAAADPIAAEQIGFQEELKNLQDLRNQDLLSHTRHLELKGQLEREHAEQMRVLQEENFKAASLGNELLMNSIDALGQSGAQALSGLLSGTTSLRDAMGSIANTVLNTVIGSFVQAGVEWVKQQIVMRAAASATTAAQVAGTAAVTTAQTAATGTIAATTTTAAATTGTAVATSMAPAAGLSSIASFGGAAVIGGAALLATMLLAKSFGGGRKAGGPVNPGTMYRVNEGGAPEVFNAGGQQYMIPNQRGEVVSNRDASAGGGSASQAPVVNVYEAAPGTTVKSSYSEADQRWVVDVVNGDINSGGKIGQSVNRITGTPRAGR